MANKLLSLLRKQFPKNYILKNPKTGSVIAGMVFFVFLMLYRPYGTFPSRFFGYELTMAVYSLMAACFLFVLIKLLRHSGFFGSGKSWTILKELLAIFLILTGLSIAIYLFGFVIEDPSARWNLTTFLDSLRLTYLIGAVPFLFFTALNIQVLFQSKLTQYADFAQIADDEQPVTIDTPLKKDELRFRPSELLYAESDGNYVNFYLYRKNSVQKKAVRSSITSVEEQLASISSILRVHRAFIVNLQNVTEASGNALGYRLSLKHTDEEIPVSRRHTATFREQFRQHG